jgi:hypothetical protein
MGQTGKPGKSLTSRSGKLDAPNAASIYLFAVIQHRVKQNSEYRDVDLDLTWNASTAAHEEFHGKHRSRL